MLKRRRKPETICLAVAAIALSAAVGGAAAGRAGVPACGADDYSRADLSFLSSRGGRGVLHLATDAVELIPS